MKRTLLISIFYFTLINSSFSQKTWHKLTEDKKSTIKNVIKEYFQYSTMTIYFNNEIDDDFYINEEGIDFNEFIRIRLDYSDKNKNIVPGYKWFLIDIKNKKRYKYYSMFRYKNDPDPGFYNSLTDGWFNIGTGDSIDSIVVLIVKKND